MRNWGRQLTKVWGERKYEINWKLVKNEIVSVMDEIDQIGEERIGRTRIGEERNWMTEEIIGEEIEEVVGGRWRI